MSVTTTIANGPLVTAVAEWGTINGILSDQTDLQAALDAKASSASPTFTGTVTLSGLTPAGVVHNSAGGVLSTSLIVNADVHASAAIAYSKLSLSASIVNADIAVGAAIAYSKLSLSASIVNADISASAAIDRLKLATAAANAVCINSAFGFLTTETTLAVSRGGLNIASYTTGDLIYASSSTVLSKQAIGSSGQVLTVSAGLPVWAASNPAEGFTTTVTSAATTTLTTSSNTIQEFTGSTQLQVVNVGDATTYSLGRKYTIINSSTQIIQVVNSGSTELGRLGPNEYAVLTLTVNGTANGTWSYEQREAEQPAFAHYCMDDFVSSVGPVNADGTGQTNWEQFDSGTASAVASTQANATTANHPGVIQITKGTTAAGRAGIFKGADTVYFGSGVSAIEMLVFITTLSDGTNTYNLRAGWGDDIAAADHVDGVYFEYASGTSVNWIMKTANNSTRTSTTSSTAVATGWNKLRIEVNGAASRVDYFVNGTNIGNVTTNIPTTAARASSPNIKVVGSVGAASRVFLLDYVKESYYFSTAR